MALKIQWESRDRIDKRGLKISLEKISGWYFSQRKMGGTLTVKGERHFRCMNNVNRSMRPYKVCRDRCSLQAWLMQSRFPAKDVTPDPAYYISCSSAPAPSLCKNEWACCTTQAWRSATIVLWPCCPCSKGLQPLPHVGPLCIFPIGHLTAKTFPPLSGSCWHLA